MINEVKCVFVFAFEWLKKKKGKRKKTRHVCYYAGRTFHFDFDFFSERSVRAIYEHNAKSKPTREKMQPSTAGDWSAMFSFHRDSMSYLACSGGVFRVFTSYRY